jgi:magnesium-transporting ATPase (P-type)
VVYVARDAKLLGAVAIADTVRPESRAAIAGLHKRNIRTILLTGDNTRVAEAIARDLGITEVEANLLPEAKVARVRQLVQEGRTVAMVGDGINDAPALAAANVGVAMGSGTDVARESADVVLLGNDLLRFVETIVVARWTRRIIYQNFAGTVAVDILGVLAALAGLIGPVIAINIHTISELIFISNSARLLPRRWDPFKRWSEAYNGWSLTMQWALAAMVTAGAIGVFCLLYVSTHLGTVEGPLGTVHDKLYDMSMLAMPFAGVVFVAALGAFILGSVRQRTSPAAIPAE